MRATKSPYPTVVSVVKLKYRQSDVVASLPLAKNGGRDLVDRGVGEREEHAEQQVEGEHAHHGGQLHLTGLAEVADDAQGDGGRAERNERGVHHEPGALADAAERRTHRAERQRQQCEHDGEPDHPRPEAGGAHRQRNAGARQAVTTTCWNAPCGAIPCTPSERKSVMSRSP